MYCDWCGTKTNLIVGLGEICENSDCTAFHKDHVEKHEIIWPPYKYDRYTGKKFDRTKYLPDSETE